MTHSVTSMYMCELVVKVSLIFVNKILSTLGGSFGVPMFLIRLEMRKWTKNRIEEILVSNSSPVSGLYEASGVKSTWSQGFQESPKK